MSSTVICADVKRAVAGIDDGATILVGGFGMAGMPTTLIDALIEQGATDLTIVSNNAGNGDNGLAALLAAGRVTKVICSFPRQGIRMCSTGSTAGTLPEATRCKVSKPSTAGSASVCNASRNPRERCG